MDCQDPRCQCCHPRQHWCSPPPALIETSWWLCSECGRRSTAMRARHLGRAMSIMIERGLLTGDTLVWRMEA